MAHVHGRFGGHIVESKEMLSYGSWPAAGLEWLGACPVCKDESRELLYGGLRDCVFFCAPGQWSLYQCNRCGSAYLDPRPTPDTIGLAYRRYFTHGPSAPGSREVNVGLGEMAHRLANGYRNAVFGTRELPALRLGKQLLAVLPSKRAIVDAGMRHIPRAHSGAALLDVGCGDGYFLRRASSAGWSVVGVDPDSKAVSVARARGLDVREGGVDVFGEAEGIFDGITLSHVIEHVHDPVETLRSCNRLLKPQGWIWIDTPNICSLGHLQFRRSWFALDAPRHLVLFSPTSLAKALEKAGFFDVRTAPWRPTCRDTFPQSETVAAGGDPVSAPTASLRLALRALRAERAGKGNELVREFITLRAYKGPRDG